MAIIYSYPHATPTINDMVLGAKFRENEESGKKPTKAMLSEAKKIKNNTKKK